MKILKFKSILLVAISFFPVWLQAKQVSQETALQVAETHLRSYSQLRSAQSLTLTLVHTETTDIQATNAKLRASEITSTNVVYYIYNVEDNGFVIVSGDDVAMPVLGYSDSGTYNPDNLPPNFVYYLSCFAQEIKGAIENNLPQSEETKKQWDDYLSGNNASLTAAAANIPLLDIEGIKWGQSTPFNLMCPTIPGTTTQAVTGCVATAMAQIMRYYKYPNSGAGTVASYSTTTDAGQKVVIPSKNLSTSNYIWSNMPAVYNSTSTPAQQNAVALLMYDCGIGAQMQYDIPDVGSGAYNWDAGNAMITNFSYSKGLTFKQRRFYSDNEWETLLKTEIDAGRPILYGGQDTINNAGHTFVCDGYNDSNYFHFNWGWNGGANGFFLSSALNVPTTPTPYKFNQYQEALFGIDRGSGSTITNYEMVLDDGATSLAFTSTKNQVINNNSDLFNVTAQYVTNIGFSTFSGSLGVALYNQTNQLIIVLDTPYTTSSLQPYYYISTILKFQNLKIPPSVPTGNYFIKPIVISASKDTIQVHVAPENSLPLTVVSSVSGLEKIDSNSANQLNVNVYETNGFIQAVADASNPIKEITVYNLQGSMIYNAASIDAVSYTVNQKLPAGTYIVKVISEKNTDNVKLILH